MRLSGAVLSTLAVVLLSAAQDPKKEAPSIQGEWQVKSLKMAGQPAPPEAINGFRSSFGDKTYTNRVGGQVVEEGTYEIDPSKSPKTIDFDIKKGDDAGKRQVGIYALEGDTFTMALSQPGATDRPTSLEAKPGVPAMVVVMQRQKAGGTEKRKPGRNAPKAKAPKRKIGRGN